MTDPASSQPVETTSLTYQGGLRPRGMWDERSLRARAEQLRRSIAPDLYTPEVYVPWEEIDKTVARLVKATDLLQELVDRRDWSPEQLGHALLQPGVLTVVRHLLVTPSAVGFADGREIPLGMPGKGSAPAVAALLLDIGLPRILPAGSSVRDLLRLGAVALDSRRRGFRRRDSIEADVRDLLQDATATVMEEAGLELRRLYSGQWPAAARGKVDNVVALDSRPIAAVASFFAGQTGGRQQRTLLVTYPELQRELDAVPLSLVLILDGRGVQEAPLYVLENLVKSVGACMSRSEARQGALAEALADAAEHGGSRPGRRVAVDTLVASALQQGPDVQASSLPVSRQEALLALAEYKAAHPDLALELDPTGRLAWARPEQVQHAQRLQTRFHPRDAVDLLVAILRMHSASEVESEQGIVGVVAVGAADPVLSDQMVIAAAERAPDRKSVQAVARLNRQNSSGSIAAYLVPDRGTSSSHLAALQRQLATSVILLDAQALLRLAGHVSPRDAFIQEVLRQADLTKANPFNPTGATPAQMFFGREEEEASLLATLGSNSAALIGGRRIGKTSLLHHAVTAMRDEGWDIYYADCQAVGNWADFVRHVSPRWNIDLHIDFSPHQLNRLAEQLRNRSDRKLVIVMDEVDNLLKWDETETDGRVSEAFFRACRAISQENIAQFIFSGERRIAAKLWDPTSPHWNFCRPIPIRQLTSRASASLLAVPLESLGVGLLPLSDILSIAWRHTSGHPQILQELGNRIVHELNALPADKRSVVDPQLLESVVSSATFARHYVETYWGQATDFEKLVTTLLADRGSSDMGELRRALAQIGAEHDAAELSAAIRMLSLYGVIDDNADSLQLRAENFPSALSALGGLKPLLEDLTASVVKSEIVQG